MELNKIYNIDCLEFLLFDGDKKVAESSDSRSILANSQNVFETFIDVDPSLQGNLNLLINLNSASYSTFFQEDIILGAPISGFSIFNNLASGTSIGVYVIVLLFLAFAIIMVRRILVLRKHHKKISKKY